MSRRPPSGWWIFPAVVIGALLWIPLLALLWQLGKWTITAFLN